MKQRIVNGLDNVPIAYMLMASIKDGTNAYNLYRQLDIGLDSINYIINRFDALKFIKRTQKGRKKIITLTAKGIKVQSILKALDHYVVDIK